MIICVGKNVIFFLQTFFEDEVYKTLYQRKLSKEFKIDDTKQWGNIYVRKIIDVEDKQLSDFNYILLNNILCNNAYFCKWKADVKADCRMCKDIKTR